MQLQLTKVRNLKLLKASKKCIFLVFIFKGIIKTAVLQIQTTELLLWFLLLFNNLTVLPTPDNWAQSANVNCFHFHLKSEEIYFNDKGSGKYYK